MSRLEIARIVIRPGEEAEAEALLAGRWPPQRSYPRMTLHANAEASGLVIVNVRIGVNAQFPRDLAAPVSVFAERAHEVEGSVGSYLVFLVANPTGEPRAFGGFVHVDDGRI